MRKQKERTGIKLETLNTKEFRVFSNAYSIILRIRSTSLYRCSMFQNVVLGLPAPNPFILFDD
jgi:hypothetical protein